MFASIGEDAYDAEHGDAEFAAPWVVDPTRLRVTLDAIHQAFSQEHVIIAPETFLMDRNRVLESVRLVLAELRQFASKGIVPGVAVPRIKRADIPMSSLEPWRPL
jgi:hypothetical protein